MNAEDCKHTSKKKKEVLFGTHGKCILSTCCTNDLHLQSKIMHVLYVIELYTSKISMVNHMLWPFYDIHAYTLHTWGFIAASFLFARFCFEIGFRVAAAGFESLITWTPSSERCERLALCAQSFSKCFPTSSLELCQNLRFFFFFQEPDLGFLNIFCHSYDK